MPTDRDTPSRRPPLRRLLHPSTLLVAGGEEAAEVIRQSRLIGFAGTIRALHPHRTAIEGVPCVRSVAELPEAPDAAFLAVPPQASIALVGELAERGAGAAVCYASGFAEVGGGGVTLQRQLVQAAGDMALLGPNCYGLLNYLDGVALWPDRQGSPRLAPGARGVALVTQSGNIALNLTMQRRHLPVAYVMALGNQAALDFHDVIDALLDDGRVSAIGLHIEGLNDVAAFSRAASKALERGMPIVALKTGASRLGAQLAASHTSALAGPDALYDALFARLGVARVADLDDLIETLKLLHACGPLPGRRVGASSCSGGEASLVADLGEAAGLRFPPLGPQAESGLREALGPRVPLANPLDYHTYIWADTPALTACFAAMMDAPIDSAMLVLDFPFHAGEPPVGWNESLTAFIAAQARWGGAAMVASSLPELMPAEEAKRLLDAGIAPMQGLRCALRAIRAAAGIGAHRHSAVSALPVTAPAPMRSGPERQLTEWAAKQALASFGLAVPPGAVVRDGLAAVAAANDIGYPVVLKAVSECLAHKTEQGAVKLDLRDAAQLASAVDALRSAGHDQWLVERMVTGGLAELIVGVTRDAQFGFALTIGAGGLWVEWLADSVTLLLPADAAAIEQALRGLKCFPLFDGCRGRPRADLAAIVSAVEAVARFAEAHADRLLELDVNPLIALPNGAVAVDALVRWVGDASETV